MTYLGLQKMELIEARQALIVGRALRRGELEPVVTEQRAGPQRYGDQDVLRGTPVLGFASKPIACLPCSYALRSPSTSTTEHGRTHG